MRGRYLLDIGQWHKRVLHNVSRGDVQRKYRVNCVERMLGLPCRGLLLVGMLIIKRKWYVWRGQLLECGQRNRLVVYCLPWRQVLSCKMQQL